MLLRTRGETERYRVGKRGRLKEGRGTQADTRKEREVKRAEEGGRKEV